MAADPYIVLGVSRTATLAEIKAAYLRRARETHPDQHPNDPHAQARFRAATAAWEAIQAEHRQRSEGSPGGSGQPTDAEPATPPQSARPSRVPQQVIITAAVAAEEAVEPWADRMSKRGGWAAVLGEAVRGAVRGVNQSAARATADPANRDPGPEPGKPRT